VLRADSDQVGQLGRVREANQQEVAGVDAQQQSGPVGDGDGVVGGIGAVGGADFDQADS
jgi:hypothetical protein